VQLGRISFFFLFWGFRLRAIKWFFIYLTTHFHKHQIFIKNGFPLVRLLQERERERENDHVGMRSLIIFLSHRKVFLSIWSRFNFFLSAQQEKLSNKVIFANTALLLFLSAIFAHTILSRLKIKYLFFHFPFSRSRALSHCQTDKWKSTLTVTMNAWYYHTNIPTLLF